MRSVGLQSTSEREKKGRDREVIYKEPRNTPVLAVYVKEIILITSSSVVENSLTNSTYLAIFFSQATNNCGYWTERSVIELLYGNVHTS